MIAPVSHRFEEAAEAGRRCEPDRRVGPSPYPPVGTMRLSMGAVQPQPPSATPISRVVKREIDGIDRRAICVIVG